MSELLLTDECSRCVERLAILERVTLSHEAKLIHHAASLLALEKKIDGLSESNIRIEHLLERVLGFVTPSSSNMDDTQD